MGVCELVGSPCEVNTTDPNGNYILSNTGECNLSCNTNFIKKNGKCEWVNKGASVGADPNGIYTYNSNGDLKLSSCNIGLGYQISVDGKSCILLS